MTHSSTLSNIDPIESVYPSAAVADASIGILSELVALRERAGRGVAQAQAMAMHNAALSYLRSEIGTEDVARLLALAGAENDKAKDRDQRSSELGQRRRAAAERKRGEARP